MVPVVLGAARARTLLLVLAACSRNAPSPAPEPAPVLATPVPTVARWPGPTVVAKARIIAGGDVLPHTNVKNSAAAAAVPGDPAEGWGVLFAGITERVRAADLAFANLETPVAPQAHRGTGSMVFNAPPALLGALRSTGFDVVSFANNHVYDQGRAGMAETLDQVRDAGLVLIGAGPTLDDARRARVLEVGGLKVAWIGATRLFNNRLNEGVDRPTAWELVVDEAVVEAQSAKAAGADAVILSVHWGREYHHAPDAAEVEAAHRLLDGGVDVILGHHPHVVQPIEAHETPDGRVGIVAYSLGNLISNQAYDYRFGVHPLSRGATRDGLLLAFDIVKKDYGPGALPREVVSVANVEALPVWTDSDANGRVVAPAPTIRVVETGPAIEAAYQALAASSEGTLQALHLRRIELLRARWWSVEQVVGSVWMPAEPR